MSVPSYDLCIKQGNNSSWEFRLKSYDADGSAIHLAASTSYTVQLV